MLVSFQLSLLIVCHARCHVLKIHKVWQPYTTKESIFHWRKKRQNNVSPSHSLPTPQTSSNSKSLVKTILSFEVPPKMEQSKLCAQEEEQEEEEKREERVFSRTNITKQNTTNYNLDGTQLGYPKYLPLNKQTNKEKEEKIDEILTKNINKNKAKHTKMLIWDKSEVVWRTCWGNTLGTWGTCWGNILRTWGTCWGTHQAPGKNEKKSSFPPPPHQNLKRKTNKQGTLSACFGPCHWLHKISLPRRVGHYFWPRLIPPFAKNTELIGFAPASATLIPQKEIVNLIVCLFVCLFVFFSIL